MISILILSQPRVEEMVCPGGPFPIFKIVPAALWNSVAVVAASLAAVGLVAQNVVVLLT